MGEQSYFQRKFCTNRFKRTKFGRPPSLPAGETTLQATNNLHQDETRSTKTPETKPDPESAGNSVNDPAEACCPAAELDEIKASGQNGVSPSQDSDSPSEVSLSNLTDGNGVVNQCGARQESPASTSDEPVMQPTSGGPHDHIETLNFHPGAQNLDQSVIGKESIRDEHKGRQSKLLKATRALLMFRRSTSGSLSNPSRTSDLKSSRSLVASFWSRQNTSSMNASNSTSPTVHSIDSPGIDSDQQQHTIQSKPSSSRTHTKLNALFGVGSGSGSGGSGRQSVNPTEPSVGLGRRQQSGSSFRLPAFIVPNINSLKLPIVCLIKSLDDELMREVFIHRYELGQYLMDNLNVSLGMKDEKYFGLKVANSLDEQEDVRRPWLDLNESVYKQVSKLAGGNSSLFASSGKHRQDNPGPEHGQNIKSITFYLRIKFYPPSLARIQDPFLRHYLWIQLRRDLRLGKLTSSKNNLTYLMACVLQYELGDHNSELINERLPQMSILPNQDLIERQAVEIWQGKLAGTKKHLALMQFLRASVILETYGFDYYQVRSHQSQKNFLLGFNYAGVKTIRNGRIANHFRWHNLSKISYERRMIIFHIYPNENSKRKQILGFKCLSNDECQNLYLRLLEQKYFFTVDLAYFDKSVRPPSLLSASSSSQPIDQLQAGSNRAAAFEFGQTQQAAAAAAAGSASAADYFGNILAGIEHEHSDVDEVPDGDRGQQAKMGGEPGELAHERRFNFRHHGNQSSYNSTFDSSFEYAHNPLASRCPSNPLSSGCNDSCSQFSQASSSYHQFPQRAPPAPPLSLHTKSSSLQDSDLPCGSMYRAQAVGYPPQPRPDSAGHHQVEEVAPHRKQLHPHLQRQCSFVSNSSDPSQQTELQLGPPNPSEWADRAESRQRSSSTPQNRERLLDPGGDGGLFWTSDETPLADGHEHRLGPNAPEMLLQGVRLCLIMLVLNFLLRLSDGLCGFLVELLSFRRHETTPTGNGLAE